MPLAQKFDKCDNILGRNCWHDAQKNSGLQNLLHISILQFTRLSVVNVLQWHFFNIVFLQLLNDFLKFGLGLTN
jgi:hypothetical protein